MINSMIHARIFAEVSDIRIRDWGSEELLVLASGKYMLRRLRMTAGSSGGLQKHHIKDEASVLLSGRLLITFTEEDGKLKQRIVVPGEHFHFPTGCIHKVTCIEDAEIIEVSTPHLNDRIRMEDAYGLDPSCCSLPTTQFTDVEHL